jgi:dTDP-D-glucose 4,6-dehydratase
MQGMLVTGGAGFIGANFVHHCLEHPRVRLVVLDTLTYAGKIENHQAVNDCPSLRFVPGSITDQSLVEEILRDERVDTLVHFAATSHVDRSIHGPAEFILTNIVGTHSLLKAARKAWLDERTVDRHRFHHVSTDEVYGSLGPGDPPPRVRRRHAPFSYPTTRRRACSAIGQECASGASTSLRPPCPPQTARDNESHLSRDVTDELARDALRICKSSDAWMTQGIRRRRRFSLDTH